MLLLRLLLWLAPVLIHAIENDYRKGRLKRDQTQEALSAVSVTSASSHLILLDSRTDSRTVSARIHSSPTNKTGPASTLTSLKASGVNTRTSTNSSSQIFSPHGSFLSPSGSSWISRKTSGGASQWSNTTETSSFPSSVTTPPPSPTARLANVSQASLSLSRSVSSFAAPDFRDAPSTATTLTSLNSSAITATPSTVDMTNTLAKSVTTPLSARTIGTGPLTASSASITTVITSPPLAFSTSTASNSDWTTDTTTLIHGTIFPVLVGCSVCGGPHHGIVVAGLGGEPTDPPRTGCGSGSIFGSLFGCGAEFDFPLLPPFIIGMDGTPIDESSGDDGSGSECEDEDRCSLRTMQSSTTSLTPSSTVPRSTASSTTSLTSIKPSEYMVFPKADTGSDGFSTLTSFFDDELGADNALQISLNDAGDQVMYIIYANESFAQKLPFINSKVESVVADVEQMIWDDPSAGASVSSLHRRAGNEYNRANEQDLAKREDADGKQESAPPELRFVSQPKGVKLDLRGDDDDLGGVVPYYAYNTVAGQDFTVRHSRTGG